MEDLVSLFVNNGTAVAVIVYFMYRDLKFQNSLNTTLQTLIDTVGALKETIDREVAADGG